MANENDGSLVFDTEIDNSGFEKGSDKLLAAIKDLTSAVDNMGDNMMRSFGKVIPLLQTVANAATNASSGITDTATQAADANERVIDSEQRVAQAAERAADAVNQQDNATGSFTRSVQNTQGSVSALEREVNSLSTGLQSVSNSAELGFANGKAVLTFDSKIQALEQRLSEARERLAEFGNTNIPTEEYNALTTQISRAEQALFRLYDRRDDMAALGVKENSAQWERLALQIQNAEDQLARFERERDSLAANGGAFIQGSETAEFARMESALNAAGETLERNKGLIDQEALAQARLNVLTAQEAVAAATTTSEREAAIARLREAQEQLNSLAQSMSNNPNGGGGDVPTEEKISMWTRLGAAMRSVGSTALQVTGNLARLPFTATARGVSKLVSAFKNFISNAKRAKVQANALVKALTSLKRMLISRIKRMFISAIFNEAKEALKTLAKFSDTFNQSMSNIKNGSKQLAGNISVTLGNVINTIEPMITALLDKLSTAFTFINALFAKLSGKTTMTVAKKQTDSYRDSLDDAAKSAEDLKNQVYGFDELNKRSGKDEDKVTDGSDLYEEMPIDSILPENIKKLFDELKELWENGDYFNFGKKLAELLNNGLQTLDDWINNTFRPKGKEWAKNIAEILNGLVDGFDWTLLGKTFADGLNAVFDNVNTFLTTFDFEKLGKGIGEAVNGWFSNIEWDLIGKTVANGLNAIINTIHGIVTTVDWAKMGDSIATFIQTFFTAVDWDKAADTISTAVNGIVTAFKHFIDGVDWNKIGSDLTTAASKAIKDIDWGTVFQTIIDAFESLEDLILGALSGIDWGGIAQSLADGINSINIQDLLTKTAKIVSDFISGLLEAATRLIEEINWQELTQKLWDGLVGMIQTVDWSGIVSQCFGLLGAAFGAATAIILTLGKNIWNALKRAWESTKEYFRSYIEEYGGDVIAGLWAGIKNAFINVGTWIEENILDPFIESFKRAFGINSPSKKMMEMGEYLIEGLLQGIKNVWNAITSFFSTAVEGIKNQLSKAWENIKSTISQKFNAVKDAVSKTAESIKSSLSTAWNNIKSTASTVWDNVKSTVTKKFEEVKTSLSNTANNIKSTVTSAWENIKTSTSQAWNTLKSTVISLWNGLKSTLQNTSWSSVGSNLVSGLKSGITNAWSGLKKKVSELAEGLTSTIKGIFDIHSPSKSWFEIGEYLDLGLERGIENKKKTVLATVSNMAKTLTNRMSDEDATLQIGAESENMVTRLGAVSDKLAEIVAAFRAINDSISMMGGFRIPVIASGSEAPYRMRIDDSDDDDVFDSNVFASFSSGLDERMSDHTYLLRRIIDLLERLKIGVNSDEIATAIAFAVQNLMRGYGG